MKYCLSKEEREALFKEHPRPALPVVVPPRVDKYMVDFLGKHLPQDLDTDLSCIQGAVLAAAQPFTSAWKRLMEGNGGTGVGGVCFGATDTVSGWKCLGTHFWHQEIQDFGSH